MAATLLIPSMAILVLILLQNLTVSNAAVNHTASDPWNSQPENYLVGDIDFDFEFLMGTETTRMLLDFNNLQTFNANDPNKQSVPECNRPPRYDSCLGQKNDIPSPENCSPLNRVNPC